MFIKLTVYFDEPFWVGVFERTFDGQYSSCRVVFGPEPKNFQVFDLVNQLPQLDFSKPMAGEKAQAIRTINPKRRQRQISREMSRPGVSTRAQEAIRLQREANKKSREQISREKKEAEIARKFELKQQEKKEKHRGH